MTIESRGPAPKSTRAYSAPVVFDLPRHTPLAIPSSSFLQCCSTERLLRIIPLKLGEELNLPSCFFLATIHTREGRLLMPSIHFLTRRAARERVAAQQALTEVAKERHQTLAKQYADKAAQLQHGNMSGTST